MGWGDETLTSDVKWAQDESELSNSRPDRRTCFGDSPGTLWTLRWVEPRAGLGDVEKRKVSASYEN
jgi:hypothetical protein